MFKKFLFFFFATALVFWGCGSDSSSSPEFSERSASARTGTDSLSVGQTDEIGSELPKSETDSGLTTCVVEEKEGYIVLKARMPNYAKTEIRVEYDGTFMTSMSSMTFMPNVSKSVVEEECDDAKANAVAYSETGLTRTVTCKDNVLTVVETDPMETDPMPAMYSLLLDYCQTLDISEELP